MSIFRRGNIYWLDVTHNGERIRRSAETGDRKEALRIHDEFKVELRRLKPSGRTFYGAIEAWKQAGKRDAADGYRIEKVKKAYHDRSLHLVTPESLAAALPSSSPGTFNRYANLVCAVMSLAKYPIEIERKETPEGRIRWLTREEWIRLRKQLPEHQRIMATFAINTGLRQANVFRLEWSQVDLKRRVAWVHPDQAKAGKAITVPLSDEAMKILRRQIGKHERLVFPYNDRAVSEIKTAWSKALKRAKIEDFTWHDLRHTWATWHIMGGTPVEVLQKLGGWADIRMVLRYAHLDPGYLAQFANNAKPRNVTRSVTGTDGM
jgi:integrase